MKRGFLWFALFSIAVILVFAPALSAQGPSKQAGKSRIGHLYLFEKDPDTWDIIPEGAWGKLKYSVTGPAFKFVFNGHHLMPGSEYTLIYYPDPWPGTGLICLGSGTANGGGNVHIAGSVQTGDMPATFDANYPTGAKIWLVLSSDVDCTAKMMIGWNPTEYLFEYKLVTYTVAAK